MRDTGSGSREMGRGHRHQSSNLSVREPQKESDRALPATPRPPRRFDDRDQRLGSAKVSLASQQCHRMQVASARRNITSRMGVPIAEERDGAIRCGPGRIEASAVSRAANPNAPGPPTGAGRGSVRDEHIGFIASPISQQPSTDLARTRGKLEEVALDR